MVNCKERLAVYNIYMYTTIHKLPGDVFIVQWKKGFSTEKINKINIKLIVSICRKMYAF